MLFFLIIFIIRKMQCMYIYIQCPIRKYIVYKEVKRYKNKVKAVRVYI